MAGAGMHDAIVVGAGFAGLAAAAALDAAGLDFVVLEARERVGGRVETVKNGLGEPVETGGQFLCDDMPELMGLVRQHGRALVRTAVDGAMVVLPEVGDPGDLYRRSGAIRDRADEIAPDSPDIAGLTVQEWTRRQGDAEDAKAAFLASIEGLWCQPTDALPLWYLVSNDRRITNTVSELQYFLKEGLHDLARAMAQPLGDRLKLSAAVTAIARDTEAVTVKTAAGEHLARHAIVAVPPVMAGRIAYTPALPIDMRGAFPVWSSGKAIKTVIRYERRFWREAGKSGMAAFLDPPGLFACDASASDDRAALVVFAGGALAGQWHAAGPQAARSAILEKLVAALGPQAGTPLDVTMRDWTGDAWSGGGYSDTIMALEGSDAEAVLARGMPRVGFASSELSPSFPGYVEGAIVAGRQAAAAVIEEFGALGKKGRR